jgi:hypothetical protein
VNKTDSETRQNIYVKTYLNEYETKELSNKLKQFNTNYEIIDSDEQIIFSGYFPLNFQVEPRAFEFPLKPLTPD